MPPRTVYLTLDTHTLSAWHGYEEDEILVQILK